MKEDQKTAEQLSSEIADLRQRVAALERTEIVLREREERYRTMVDMVPHLTGWADAQRRLIQCNHRWYEYTGQTPKEAEGLGWLQAIHPDDLQSVRQRIEESVAAQTPYEAEFRLRSALDGAFRWHLGRSVPIKDKDGRVAGWVGCITDIDDQKQAEVALRESEERFRRVFEDGPIGILLVGTDGVIRHCNRRFAKMLGYKEDEVIALGLPGISHPDDWKQAYPIVSSLWRGERQSYEMERRYVCRGGKVITGRLMVSLMQDAEGKPINTIGMIEDITERKLAEQSLRRSEAKYRRLHESLMDAFVSADMDGRIREFNACYQAMLGYEPEVLRTLRSADITPEKWHAFERRVVHDQVLTRGYSDIYEKEYRRKDGSVFPVELKTFLVKDDQGRPASMWAIVRDITARKHAEAALATAHQELERHRDHLEQLVKERTEELRQSHDELRTIYDQIKDGIAVVDAEKLRIVHANTAFCRMTGYSADEICTVSTERFHPPEVYRTCSEHFKAVLNGTVAWASNVPFLRKDGGTIYFDVVSNSIRYNDRASWISFFHDVTERKRAEEALQRQHRTLKDLLQSSDHERQLIAYEIHDELAQQLAGAVMQFQTYAHQKRCRPRAAEKAFEAGMTMLRQGHDETRRLIAGVRPPILDDEGVIPAISHLVNEERRQKGPQIEFRSDVEFDRLSPTLENAIYRIVQEALTNACKHSQSKRVRVSLWQRGDFVRIRVRDHGIGFDTTQVHEKRFGLVGIRQRVKLLDGKCKIRSEPGKGTCIAVELPVVERD